MNIYFVVYSAVHFLFPWFMYKGFIENVAAFQNVCVSMVVLKLVISILMATDLGHASGRYKRKVPQWAENLYAAIFTILFMYYGSWPVAFVYALSVAMTEVAWTRYSHED